MEALFMVWRQVGIYASIKKKTSESEANRSKQFNGHCVMEVPIWVITNNSQAVRNELTVKTNVDLWQFAVRIFQENEKLATLFLSR